jgi:L-asparaginase II
VNQPNTVQTRDFLRDFLPVAELTRGDIVESVHLGAAAVVDAGGRLLASYGNPYAVTYLRSSAKPIQALQFVEDGGVERFGFTDEELSLICASHHGSDHHAAVAASMQQKIGVSEDDLLCGVHWPSDKAAANAMLLRGEKPTPNRHNCSGKHTGMLASCKLHGFPIEDYIRPDHPLQQLILKVNSEMWDMQPEQVHIGIDGCSVPVFGIPLYNAALGFARLSDPAGLPQKRAEACQHITRAMTGFPKMVANDGAFDTELMRAGRGRWVSKIGAEGYQNIGVGPGLTAFPARGIGSPISDAPGIGVAVKILDGDQRGGISSLTGLEVLRQLGALSADDLAQLSAFHTRPIKNWRGFEVGILRPVFDLEWK